MSLDRNTTLGELLGHLSGALAAKTGDAPAAHREAALKLTLADAEAMLDVAPPAAATAEVVEAAESTEPVKKKPKGT